MEWRNKCLSDQSAHEIMDRMCKSVRFPDDLEHPEVNDFPEFGCDEIHSEFRAKIAMIWKNIIRANLPVESLVTWKRIDIENLTGNQLLKLIIAIYRNKELSAVGNCIVFTVANRSKFGLIRLPSETWQVITPSVDKNPASQKYYDKIFDRKRCEEQARGPFARHYQQDRLQKIRDEVPEMFQDFLEKPMSTTKFRYMDCTRFHNAFIGVLAEIAKYETRDGFCYQIFKKISVAACVFLAVRHGFTPELQSVFGDHGLNVEGWREEYDKNGIKHPGDWGGYMLEKKFELRYNAAKQIVKKSFTANEDGSHKQDEVENTISQIKRYFEIFSQKDINREKEYFICTLL